MDDVFYVRFSTRVPWHKRETWCEHSHTIPYNDVDDMLAGLQARRELEATYDSGYKSNRFLHRHLNILSEVTYVYTQRQVTKNELDALSFLFPFLEEVVINLQSDIPVSYCALAFVKHVRLKRLCVNGELVNLV